MSYRSAAVAALLVATLLTGCGPARKATLPAGSPSPSATGGSPEQSPSPDPSPPGASPPASPSATAARTSAPGAPVAGALSGKVIVVDPGHNGGNGGQPEVVNRQVDVGNGKKACDTTGTQTYDGLREHAFTWDVATRLAALLRAAGATVIMTRDGDSGVGPCIDERAAIANRNRAHAAVSIHGDGGPDGGHGFHIMEPKLIAGYTDAIVAPSHQLAVAIRDAYKAGTDIVPATYIGQDGINPRSDMGGLNLSKVPKVMVECGNMRNTGDAVKMADPGHRQRIAAAIAAGLVRYLAS